MRLALRSLPRRSARYFNTLNRVFSFLASVVTVLGAVVILVNYHQIADAYGRTFRTNAYWEGVLNSLSVQQNLDIFNEKLGKSTFSNRVTDGYVQHVFVQPAFYVTVLVNKDGKALTYSITTRKQGFTPYIKKSGVRLGVTTFAQLPAAAPRLTGGQDDSPYYYYEEMYGGGYKGNWLTHVYATSDAGLKGGFSLSYWPLATSSWRDYQAVATKACQEGDTSLEMLQPIDSPPDASTGYGQYLLDHREKVAITSVGFISPMPTFLCDILHDNKDLPVFAPDRDQTTLLEQ